MYVSSLTCGVAVRLSVAPRHAEVTHTVTPDRHSDDFKKQDHSADKTDHRVKMEEYWADKKPEQHFKNVASPHKVSFANPDL